MSVTKIDIIKSTYDHLGIPKKDSVDIVEGFLPSIEKHGGLIWKKSSKRHCLL